ncbi:MAG: GDP-mannose-dependent alpha-(1-6)-phosphatidylinositol monomannoside mannosyltransferase [Syntrophus sp. PtaU1.Bin005]|jgi:glycosyltransferase involved in cell wall biosynthesis|nr:MAG: GDP-mannose-dependent alpha-(1-6)-phosphatidylinositol monomannoside mannosyltransferase [Syntrophus sp. PtaU1.Bin005]
MMNQLDGLTVLRFTKAFRSGGGIEQYLDDLDRTLLKRNRAKIIRTYLEKEPPVGEAITGEIGQGRLIEIPLPFTVGMPSDSIYNIDKSGQLKPTKRNAPRPGLFQIRNAAEKFRKIHEQHNVDLLIMHYLGTVDSLEIVQEAKKLKIPSIFINHFSNAYFKDPTISDQLSYCSGVAGVSGIGVPRKLKREFCNLSDGIDMEVFNPAQARPLEIETDLPIIFYPARILRLKGQHDVIKAYASLRNEGVRATIVLAGRTDSAEYEEELRGMVSKYGFADHVLLIGQLNQEEMRDWYGVSSMMAFPTYHQEGLGRILIEAQAMKVPVVAYRIGGTPEGIVHGKTGFLVRKGDLKSFADRLKELLTDGKKRKAMGEEGRMFVQKKFSLEAFADRHEQYYATILSHSRNVEHSELR